MAIVMSQAIRAPLLSRLSARMMPGCLKAGCLAVFLAGFLGGCVPVFHRTLPDLIYSGVTGRDCSMVRLDRGDSYCRTVDPPLPPQPYCTRSLAGVDCWAQPERMSNLPPQVAELPHEPTAEQNRVRLARWPADLQ
jgi:hypothetical protein